MVYKELEMKFLRFRILPLLAFALLLLMPSVYSVREEARRLSKVQNETRQEAFPESLKS